MKLQKKQMNHKQNIAVLLYIVIAAALVLILCVICLCLICLHRKNKEIANALGGGEIVKIFCLFLFVPIFNKKKR